MARSSRDRLEAMVEELGGPLTGFLARLVGNRTDAEDLAQETLVRAIEHLDEYDERFALSTWLYTIAHRLTINWWKRRKPARLDPRDGASLAGGEDPGREVEEKDARERLAVAVWAAVAELPELPREAVLLFYREGLSCRDVSRVLDMPLATVKSHLHRARRRLREMLVDRVGELMGE